MVVKITRDDMIYLLPLAGIMAGTAMGKVMGTRPRVTEALMSLCGPVFGPIISFWDNLALVGGLAGFVLATMIAWLWIRRMKAEERSKINVK